MPAKLRQLGCVCVAPTPFAHACADAGRSDRRAVGPTNTMRATAKGDPGGDGEGDGPLAPSQPKSATKLATPAMATAHVRTAHDTDTPGGAHHRKGGVPPCVAFVRVKPRAASSGTRLRAISSTTADSAAEEQEACGRVVVHRSTRSKTPLNGISGQTSLHVSPLGTWRNHFS
jgi:hypothetical protein